MAIVEIWGDYGLTGHASVCINNRSNCSFHPVDGRVQSIPNDVLGSKGIFYNRSFDIENHGRPANQIELNFVNHDSMESQFYDWIGGAKSGDLKYSLAWNNCSRIAAQLICVGADIHWSFFKHIDQLVNQISRSPFRHDSARVAELVQDTIEDYAITASRVGKLPKNKTLPILLGMDILSRSLVWTPGDVRKFAKMLSSHNHP